MAPIGLAMPWPAMSGAEPWTGSNIDGYSRSGFRLPEGAMPIEPATAAARSLRMSPNRFEATITSNRPGSRTIIAARASISTCSLSSCGWADVTWAKRSSQKGIVWMIPLDFVAEQMRPERVRRQRAGVLDDAIGPAAGEDRLLDGELVLGALVQASADLRVLALVVLAHDHHVDVGRRDVAQRRGDARPQPDRPQVHVLPEGAADRDQQAPQRHVVGHIRPADGAEEDRVAVAQGVERVGGHHAAGLDEVIAAPRMLGQLAARTRARARPPRAPRARRA